MGTIKNYLSLIKFSHTIFALPFALIGFFLGYVQPGHISQWNLNRAIGWGLSDAHKAEVFIIKLPLVILCMITARSAAMSFNRYLDRHFDAKNPRTAIREIPKGILSANRVLLFVIVCCIAFIICTFFINSICFALSPVALFVVLFYSYTKRFTPLCHIVLGLGLSLAPIGSYLAVSGRFDILPILFSLAVIFWVSGFDIIYALQDEAFDKENKLYSIPASLGKAKALRISELLHIACAAIVVYAGVYGEFGWLYWTATVIFVCMLIYQHSIVKPDDLSKVNIAFMTANGIASVVFGALVIADMLLFTHQSIAEVLKNTLH